MKKVFLSASVPLPDRDPAYYQTADVIAIRDSIKALVTVLVPHGLLVFGGHPAITPLVRLLVRDMKRPVRQHVILFQSRFFQRRFPSEANEFEQIRLVPAVRGNREASLRRMRDEMINSQKFDAAIFIGGMDGVEEEFEAFRKAHPKTPTYPIASTGAAAKKIFEKHFDSTRDTQLLTELTYPSLFRSLLQL